MCCISYSFDPKHPTKNEMRPVTTKIRKHIESVGYRDMKSDFMATWGYGKEEKTFGISININSLRPFRNSNFNLLLGCFSNEDKSVVYETEEMALSKCWEIPTDLPSEVALYVDCSMFAEKLNDGDAIWGILFLIRGGIDLKKIKTLGDVVRMGGRVLEGRGNAVH